MEIKAVYRYHMAQGPLAIVNCITIYEASTTNMHGKQHNKNETKTINHQQQTDISCNYHY